MEPGVILEGVSKHFAEGACRVEAVRGVSAVIERGRLTALVGPSGSGKTTLLHLIGGLERPDAGRILMGEHEISALDEAALSRLRRAKIATVFQQANILADLSLAENVALPLALNRCPKRDREERAAAAIAHLGLTPRAGALPRSLSGGEQQRAALARAVVLRPSLILADEPTAHLDSEQTAQVAQLLRRLAEEEGITILMATHDPAALSHAHALITLHDGALDPTLTPQSDWPNPRRG